MRKMSISRNGALPLGFAAAVIVAALVAGTIMPGRATAQTTFTATLSGDAEVPAVTTDASGSFTATIADGALDFSLTSDATGITQAHIHYGMADENGNVVAFLFGLADPAVDGVETTGTITVDDLLADVEGDWDTFVDSLDDGHAYVNVHTEANPGGEVRGTIAAVAPTDEIGALEPSEQATSFSATLSGDAEVPPLASDGSGSFSATITDGALDFTLTAAATGITASHIHLGGPDENGGVVAFLFGPADPAVDTVDTSGTITVDDLLDPWRAIGTASSRR